MTNKYQKEIETKLTGNSLIDQLGARTHRAQQEQDYEKEANLWQKVNPTRIKEREFWLIEELEKLVQ